MYPHPRQNPVLQAPRPSDPRARRPRRRFCTRRRIPGTLRKAGYSPRAPRGIRQRSDRIRLHPWLRARTPKPCLSQIIHASDWRSWSPRARNSGDSRWQAWESTLVRHHPRASTPTWLSSAAISSKGPLTNQSQPAAAYSGHVALGVACVRVPECMTSQTRLLPKRLTNRKLTPRHTYTSSFTCAGLTSSR
jgi:hypothetical protein